MDPASAAHADRRPRRSDWLIAAGVAAVAQIEVWATQTGSPKAAYALAALAMTVPLAWRRPAPIAVLVLVFVPLFAMKLAGDPIESAYVTAVLVVAFSAVGAFCPRRQALGGLALGIVLLGALLVVENAVVTEGVEPPVAGDFVFLGAIMAVVWALGVGLRERSLRADELEERADRLEEEREERARAAVAQERARIARELHDVVSHSISVIAVQTGSMRRRLRHDRPDEATELLATEQTARQALAEMRRMLGLLRADEDGASLAPQPGMDQVGALVEQLSDAGLAVDLEVSGERRALPPGLDLAAYRIVQEALTNVLRHAGPARARVAVRYGDRELELEVADDGRGPGPERNGQGHGIIGMRERVTLYGGSLSTGPADDGGFVVRAVLPIPGP
ncbi:MAG: sensor histidine kinase [Actinobacteria bacterium]|nr:sensor histidine kinase [Actinomycetota bacterium]